MKIVRFPSPMTYDDLYDFLLDVENFNKYQSVKLVWIMIRSRVDGVQYDPMEMLEFVTELRRDNIPVWTDDKDACYLLDRLTTKLAEMYARQTDA